MPRLSPPYCLACAQPGTSQLCQWCATAPLAVDGIRAPFLYLRDGLVQRVVYSFKYHNVRAIAPELGQLLADYLASSPVPGDALAPVPLHKRRLRSRGYNQSVLLAREVGKRTGLPVMEDALVRTRNTRPQVSLSREERVRNVEGSFACTGKVKGLRIILVDDVVTTGSTLSACAAALRAEGVESVWGLALAREGHRSSKT